jgi:hypothetical protein
MSTVVLPTSKEDYGTRISDSVAWLWIIEKKLVSVL